MRKKKAIIFMLLIIHLILILAACTPFFVQADPSSNQPPSTLNNKKNLESMYERTKPNGPSGDLHLDLIAFPYCGLNNIRKSNNPDADIQLLDDFTYLVCSEPGRLSLEEKAIANVLKDKVKIFGYIYLGNQSISLDKLKSEIDNIAEANWYGVFIDQFGYDFYETRPRQNIIVDYAHDKNLSCFVNAWFIDDALGSELNPEHNPEGEPAHLGKGDWYLLESFLMNNSGYTDWETSWKKYIKAKKYKEKLGINIAVLSYKPSTLTWEDALPDIRRSYMIALSLGFDGWWYSDKLEDINFLFGNDPGLNWGNELLQSMHETLPNIYVAETDLFYLVFNAKTYPPIHYILYDKNKPKKQ